MDGKRESRGFIGRVGVAEEMRIERRVKHPMAIDAFILIHQRLIPGQEGSTDPKADR